MTDTALPWSSQMCPSPASHRGRPSAEQSVRIGQRILDAAWTVLLEQGPELFSIDRVAIIAQVSKQTIYARHAGKLPLLDALLKVHMGQIFAELRELIEADHVETALADQARRAVDSMISPTSRMVDRLVDWIDAGSTSPSARATRAALYHDSVELVGEQLRYVTRRWGVIIEDVPGAAGFWLDGLYGHARGLPSAALQCGDWPLYYARYFLRAVAGKPE